MDIRRDPAPKRRKRQIQIGLAVAVLAVLTAAISQIGPAAPRVDRADLWIDTVQKGTMLRQIRGPGTLVPEQVRWITAVTAGRVEQILELPGTEVTAETPIIRLTNPDVEVEFLRAQQQLSDAEANLIALRSTLETGKLTQEGVVLQTRALHLEAKRTWENNKTLYDTNPELVALAAYERSREVAEELEARYSLEQRRLTLLSDSMEEQFQAQQRQVERLRAITRFNQDRVASMDVTAGVAGVLAELPLQEGQWVTAGGTLARVVQPGRLKAELRIPQTQAQDIVVGQAALVDTRNDSIRGRVTRIDPAVQNGTVTIDISLPDELPRSARPDLSVDGIVEIERLDDVVYMSRPAYGQANSRVGMFRLTPDGKEAERINVLLGRSSVTEMEVAEGLNPGDVIVLSDVSQWDRFDRIRIR